MMSTKLTPLLFALLILSSCGIKAYEEMHSSTPRLLIKDGPDANERIEDLKSKGYVIKKVRPSAFVKGLLVIFYELPEEKQIKD